MSTSFVMYDIVFKIMEMSITASVAILAVLPVRLLLKKAPKVFSYALWGIVLFRLLCPVSFSSQFSLMNFTEPVRSVFQDVEKVSRPQAGYTAVYEGKPAGISDSSRFDRTTEKPEPGGMVQDKAGYTLHADPIKKSGAASAVVLTAVWLLGILILLVVNLVSYIRTKRQLSSAMPFRENIFLSDEVDTPFCLGILKPRIYLPSALEETERSYIILHEMHHIKRGDHIIKVAAFAALCLHWFNPLVWVSFVLAGRDMEMSCDEAVMRRMEGDIRAEYSESLLRLATGKRIFTASPLAFGEGNPKQRIKNIMNYRRPGFWLILGGAVVCAVISFVLLTDPERIALFDNVDPSALECVYVYYPDGTQELYREPEHLNAIVDFMDSMKCHRSSADGRTGIGMMVDFVYADKKRKSFIFHGNDKVSVGDYVEVVEEVRRYNEKDGTFGVVIDGGYVTVDDYPPIAKYEAVDVGCYRFRQDYNGELKALLNGFSPEKLESDAIYSTSHYEQVHTYTPEEKITEEPASQESGDRKQEFTLTFTIEGMTEEVPANLVVGADYTLLIPAEGWKMSAPELWCLEEDPMVSIWVAGPIDSTEPLSDEAVKEKLAEMGFSRMHPITHTYRRLHDGYFTDVDVKRDEKDSVWYVFCSYPEEAEEGWGRRLHTIADSFNAVPKMLELTEEEKKAEEVVSAFAVAYLKNDTETMETYLKDGVQTSLYDMRAKEPVIEHIHGLNLLRSVAAREHEYGEVSVTFRPSPDADAFQYLTVGLEYTDGAWKVPWYYLDA